MGTERLPRFEIDGRPATAGQLSHFAMDNYGHFTALQVRGGATRGLDLHLARLDAATRELFGTGLDGDRVRELVRRALGDDVRDAAVRVNVFRPAGHDEVSLLVSVRAPAPTPRGPWSLMTVPYVRPVPHVKHVGGFGQAYYARLARSKGYDEALLTGHDGTVAEGAVTNVGFLSGGQVVWPDAPALDGIGMLVLRRELTAAGVPWLRRTVRTADIASYDGALVISSRGMVAVSRVDDTVLPTGSALAGTVSRVFADAPWDTI
jgi:branched-subunit amino acid aminotransferase/4-amino-4-deoxychorismate lyase